MYLMNDRGFVDYCCSSMIRQGCNVGAVCHTFVGSLDFAGQWKLLEYMDGRTMQNTHTSAWVEGYGYTVSQGKR